MFGACEARSACCLDGEVGACGGIARVSGGGFGEAGVRARREKVGYVPFGK